MEKNYGNKAYVNLYYGDSAPNLVGFATVLYNGFRISNIQIRLRRDGENTYVDFPHTFRKKEGEYVKDVAGYSIKDYIVNPINKEVRDEIESLIEKALIEELNKADHVEYLKLKCY